MSNTLCLTFVFLINTKVQQIFIFICCTAHLTPHAGQTNPRRQCSVKDCTRKTELYCSDCSTLDYTNGHRLFFVCGAGQRVQYDRREKIDGARNPNYGKPATITNPFCYKYHLDHLHDLPTTHDDDADEDV